LASGSSALPPIPRGGGQRLCRGVEFHPDFLGEQIGVELAVPVSFRTPLTARMAGGIGNAVQRAGREELVDRSLSRGNEVLNVDAADRGDAFAPPDSMRRAGVPQPVQNTEAEAAAGEGAELVS